MEKFITDFEKYTNLILSDESFAYARYADGEVMLMQGRGVGQSTQAFNVDRWSSPDKQTVVGAKLLESLSHKEANYHYAISSHSDNIADCEYLLSKIENPNITFANLWINQNYSKMKAFYESLSKPVYVICNQLARKAYFPFQVLELFPFPDDCVNYWEMEGDFYIEQLLDYSTQVDGQTFFVSAGPVSEILIHEMYQTNPNNQYVDVGSSLDEFIYGRKTRPYMDPNSFYAQQISYFRG